MAVTRGKRAPSEEVSYRRLLWAAPVAGVVAAVLNAVVYLVSLSVGAIPEGFDVNGRGPLTLGPVVSLSFIPALFAAAVFALLGRFTRRPVRNFCAVSAVLLVLSFYTPFTIAGARISMILALWLMHVVAAAAIVGVLVALARKR